MAHKKAIGATWVEFARALLLVANESAVDDLASLEDGVSVPHDSESGLVDTKSSLREALDSFVDEIELGLWGIALRRKPRIS